MKGRGGFPPPLYVPNKVLIYDPRAAGGTRLMWVNHKSRFEFVHVRLGEWLGWPQASPREPLRCHISSLVIVETLKDSFEDLANKTDTTMVTSKRKFDFEG